MQKTEKFFIFSWKELTVIGLLFVISVGFFFTLGLHYGKKINKEQAAIEAAAPNLEESPELIPPKEHLDEASQHAAGATQDTIKAATQDELDKSGLIVDEPRPVDLPSEKISPKKQAAHGEHAGAKHEVKHEAKHETKHEAKHEEAAHESGKFAIQLGSYPAKKEAQLKVKALQKRDLQADIKNAVVNGSTRYRVVLSGFKTKAAADQRGKELRSKHKIESFVVIKAD